MPLTPNRYSAPEKALTGFRDILAFLIRVSETLPLPLIRTATRPVVRRRPFRTLVVYGSSAPLHYVAEGTTGQRSSQRLKAIKWSTAFFSFGAGSAIRRPLQPPGD